MDKAKKRTIATIISMTIFAIIVLLFYYYWSNRTQPLDASGENQTEVEKLINKDFNLYYPETPREVVKLFASMMKGLYNNPKDDKIKDLALKTIELYDEEFLMNNPKDTYLNNLYADMAAWRDNNRKITNFLLTNEDQEREKEIDGVNYATVYVSFTIQENIKYTETWDVILRQDASGKWKILDWKLDTQDDMEE